MMNPVSFGSTFKIVNPNSPAKAAAVNSLVDECETQGNIVYDTFKHDENGSKVITTIIVPEESDDEIAAYCINRGINFIRRANCE